jgi:hypothetical protein
MKDLKYLNKLVNSHNQWMLYGAESIKLIRNNDKDASHKISFAHILFLKITLVFIALSKIFFLYLSQFSLNKIRPKSNINTSHYVAQLERDYRHKNYFKYINPANEISHEMIKIFDRQQYTKFRFLPLKNILKHAYKNYKNVFLFLHYEHTEKLSSSITKNVVTNIATYSYFCAIFQNIKDKNIEANYYNSGGEDLSTYASIQEGIRTHFIAHGLIDFIPMILYPRFASCLVYSEIEANTILKAIGGSAVNLYPIEKISQQDKVLIIYLDYEKDLTTSVQDTLGSVVKFFIEQDHMVYIKPHPDSNGMYIHEFIKTNKCKLLDIDEDSTDLVLKKMKASFVAGWGSTTECEALRCGVLPINLFTVRPNHHCKYPFVAASLNWPKSQEKIKNVINNPDEYAKTLSELVQQTI